MVTDSLRYWVTEMNVDGFRFDLATILGREPYGFDEGGGFLDSCRQDPILVEREADRRAVGLRPGRLSGRRLSAGLGRMERPLPRHGARVLEGRRRQGRAELATRITGSGDKFNHRGRRPWASVNFITAHDGFTLNDLVSYNDKHNEANGEDNNDGHSDNKLVELRRRRPDRRPGDPHAARAPEAQHARDAAVLARHADAARGRRVRPHAAGQQQRVLPGQRDQLGRLGRHRRRRPRADRVRAQADDAASHAAGAASRALSRRANTTRTCRSPTSRG